MAFFLRMRMHLLYTVIEYLPAELKARLAQIRELDGQVQGNAIAIFFVLIGNLCY